jgi:hypothetical protein
MLESDSGLRDALPPLGAGGADPAGTIWRSAPDGFATIVIRRGKGDQESQVAVAPITLDALRHLQAWIAAGLEAGPLFRAVLKGGRPAGCWTPATSGVSTSIWRSGLACRPTTSPG